MGRRRTHEQTAAQLLQYCPMKPEAPTPANALTAHPDDAAVLFRYENQRKFARPTLRPIPAHRANRFAFPACAFEESTGR